MVAVWAASALSARLGAGTGVTGARQARCKAECPAVGPRGRVLGGGGCGAGMGKAMRGKVRALVDAQWGNPRVP